MADPFGRSRMSRVDRSGIYSAYEEWPILAERGFGVSGEIQSGEYRRVAFLAVGGSASAGDIISGWLAARGGVEVSVFKGSLPRLDMRGTLVLACSASGGTLETIKMMERAADYGAAVVAVSSGGELVDKAVAAGFPHVEVPKAKAPRYMLPFMLFASLRVIDSACGLRSESEVAEAIAGMEDEWDKVKAEVPPAHNPAKGMAAQLRRATPKVYGTSLTRGVGVRFCNAVNENAKANAFFEEVPEAMHNDVESWETPDRRFVPVLLRCAADDRLLADRMGWFASAIRKKGAAPVEVQGEGASPLAQLVTLAYRLDMASYYLAMAKGVDPLPTRLLTSLRHRLGST